MTPLTDLRDFRGQRTPHGIAAFRVAREVFYVPVIEHEPGHAPRVTLADGTVAAVDSARTQLELGSFIGFRDPRFANVTVDQRIREGTL